MCSIALRGRDRPAFVENAKQEVLAAGRRQDHADRGAHQAGRGRVRREELGRRQRFGQQRVEHGDA
jgi:hypothetical protein